MTEFNLDQVEIQETSKYLKPGVYTPTIAGFKTGKSASKGTPFIEMIVKVAEIEQPVTFYFKEGKNFEISLQQLKKIGVAAIGPEKFKTGSLSSIEDFSNKLSALLVGSKIQAKFRGKAVSGTKGNFIKAEFAFAASINDAPLTFDPAIDIEKLPESVAKVDEGSDLPF